jgi:hypothetical protein
MELEGAKGVIQIAVMDLVQADSSCRTTGATVSRKNEVDGQAPGTSLADVVIVADDCFSNFRNVVMGVTALTGSEFVVRFPRMLIYTFPTTEPLHL